MSQGSFHISDAEFWGDPFKGRDDLEDPLFADEKDALLVDGPCKVTLDIRRTLPVAALRVSHFALATGVPFNKFAILVCSEIESGRVRVGRAVTPSAKREVPDQPSEGEGMTGEAHLLDLRKQLDLPWKPGHLAVSLILREQISDPLHVALELSPGAYRDLAVEEQREKDRLAAPPPELHPKPGAALPAWGKLDDAPEVPAAAGLVLSGPRVVKLHSREPLVVKGSFRVQLPRNCFVSGERAAGIPLDPKPAALVPITLVITGSKAPAPFRYDLVVPSWDADASTGIAAGQFAVDLDDAGNLRSTARTLFVYAFAGAARFGPLPIGLDEEG